MPFSLRPYQCECLEQLRRRYAAGRRRLLVSLPTGTGKTVIFAALPKFFGMKKRLLVLAHRQELLDQAAAKFQAAAPDLKIGIEQGQRHAPEDARIVVASVPTLGRETSERLASLDPEQFYLIVADEAHHAVADSYRRILDHFGLFAPDTRRLLIGFTATPRRGDKRGLAEVFEEVAYARGLPEMIREGFLCPVRGWRIRSSVALDDVRVRHGEFVESDLARAVDVPDRNRLVVRAYLDYAPGRRALVFAVNVAHAKTLAAEFAATGVRAAAVWGAMPPADRQTVLERFRGGQLDVLTNCNVLTEGFDEPRVDCVLMARPTQSQLLYAQMVGRGTRLHPDKSDVTVIDVVDNSQRHKLGGLNALFELPTTLDLSGAAAVDVADRLERMSAQYPWVDLERIRESGELEVAAERVDLCRFAPPVEIAAITDFAWCKMADGGFRLNLLDGEAVVVRENHLGLWDLSMAGSSAVGGAFGLPATFRELGKAVSAVDAAVAKYRPEATRVLHVDAGWRNQPPTERQLEVLRRTRTPIPKGLTRGQASWMIAMSKAR